jgi:dihydropyrimidinase
MMASPKDHQTSICAPQALAGGVLSLVATDHASFNSAQKAKGRNDFRLIPNGVHGLEERVHVVWDEMVNSGESGSE